MTESSANAYQLCFRSLFQSGRGYAFLPAVLGWAAAYG